MLELAESAAGIPPSRLLSARSALFATLCVTGAAIALWDEPLQSLPLLGIVGAIGAFAVFDRVRTARGQTVGQRDVALQLAIDVLALTALLYFSGGWTNPLVSLYLVPIAIAAAVLPAALAWAVMLAALLGYAIVAIDYVPIRGPAATFTSHVLGMWLTFVVAAVLIAYFGTTMAAALRARAQALTDAREENLRSEQIIGLATLAAGTAHELSTPLNTVTVIASELRTDADAATRAELDVMLAQLDACKDILRRLRDAAAGEAEQQDVADFIDAIAMQFQLLRPEAAVALDCAGARPRPRIVSEPTLRQALLNLLDNAADASPGAIDLVARWSDAQLTLDILDRGTGFALQDNLRVRPPPPNIRSRRAWGSG